MTEVIWFCCGVFVGYQVGYLRGDAAGWKLARRLYKSDSDFWFGEYRAYKAALLKLVPVQKAKK